jgi:RND family efflux transporter MFP subunit
MQNIKNILTKIKEYYQAHPKRFWIVGGILAIVLVYSITHKAPSTITVVPVTSGDLKQTVLATGQVTSATDLNLSFFSSGIIETLPVSVGDKVQQGQVIATLRNNNEYAALKLAKANYQKVAEGSSNEEVAVAQATLTGAQTSFVNIQRAQDTLVDSAHRAYLNVSLVPTLTSGTIGTAPTITGTYAGDTEGSYTIVPHVVGTAGYFTYSGLENGTGTISTTAPMPLGTKGLFIQFAADFISNQNDVWTLSLPNTASAGYLTAYNAYQNALKTHDSAIAAAQTSVDQAQANLDLKKAVARPADLAAAQASVDQAQAVYENTILRAPTSGTIAHVDTKIGERADVQKEIVVLQDISNLHIEANINETNIAKVVVGQNVLMTLDAFGPDVLFSGTVIEIDPSSTANDGVVNYKITVSINDATVHGVRPGMNANMTIVAWQHAGVLAIPKTALITRNDGTYVRIVLDDANDKFEERKVVTGLLGDGNMIEITSGLKAGERVALGQ